jgi:hypothetical protein
MGEASSFFALPDGEPAKILELPSVVGIVGAPATDQLRQRDPSDGLEVPGTLQRPGRQRAQQRDAGAPGGAEGGQGRGQRLLVVAAVARQPGPVQVRQERLVLLD